METKKNLKKIAFTGLLSGLCVVAGSLSANVEGMQIARGGCGTKGCSSSSSAKNNAKSANDDSSSNVKPTDSDSSDASINNKIKNTTDTDNSTDKNK